MKRTGYELGKVLWRLKGISLFLLPLFIVPCMGAVYMKLGSIDGESQATGHVGWIELDSVQWGGGRSIVMKSGSRSVGKAELSEMEVSKRMDKASVLLWFEALAGSPTLAGQIDFVAGGEKQPYFKVEIDGVAVSHYRVSGGGTERPSESLSLNFTKIETEYDFPGEDRTWSSFDLATATGSSGSSGNIGPSISLIGNVTVDEDQQGSQSFTVSDPDDDAASLTLSALSSNTSLIRVSDISFGGSGGSRTILLTPRQDQSGVSTITVAVSDGFKSSSTSFLFTVNAVNDPPSPTSIPPQTVSAGSCITVPIQLTDPDSPVGDLDLSASSLTPDLLGEGTLGLSGTGAVWSLEICPLPGIPPGTATVQLVSSDNLAADTNLFDVVIVNQPDNLGPSCFDTAASPRTTLNASPLALKEFYVTDPDAGDADLELTVTTGNAFLGTAGAPGVSVLGNESMELKLTGGQVELNALLAAGGLIYEALPGFAAVDEVTFVVNDLGNTGDGGALTSTCSVSVRVFQDRLHQWQFETFGLAVDDPTQEGILWGAEVDLEPDGLKNVFEFLLDLDPVVDDSDQVPLYVFSNGVMSLTLNCLDVPDWRLQLEARSGLIDTSAWSRAVTDVQVTGTPTGGGFKTVRFDGIRSPTNESEVINYRLVAEPVTP